MTKTTMLTGFQKKVRQIGHALPYNYFSKKIASVLLRLAGGTIGQAFEVSIFDNQRACLHPYDNISEKRVFITPQFWDPAERAFLAKQISNHPKKLYTFVDIGANAGLYSLFTLSACQKSGKQAKIICVEPDPLMHERMVRNLTLSGATDQATLLDWAITATRQKVHLHLNSKSRGMNKLSAAPAASNQEIITVEGHPLLDIFNAGSIDRIDALKMDIEGAEFPALQAFFQTAEEWQKPGLFILETSHEGAADSALGLCLKNGYEVRLQNPLNSILIKT